MNSGVETTTDKLLRKREVAILLACSQRTVDRLEAIS